ncbi:ABC transporter transmembrane region domain-containing protein [Ditylenchus destructor]|uniref:ABC transporter transmembrane region domain-containing protein n=1 Tax=Ditylenchus destructor TaxID=166010 RepID=A0AAD4N864_9BILA|nr:ABC transporter transmembrane region domain-containing protein [Ditylenchus destructor]
MVITKDPFNSNVPLLSQTDTAKARCNSLKEDREGSQDLSLYTSDEDADYREMGAQKTLEALSGSIPLAKKAKTKKKNGNVYQSASFLDMLRYADYKDWLLLICGLITSVGTGCATPLQMIIFRGITDALMEGQAHYDNGTLNMDDFSAKIMAHVWQYFILGVVSFILIKAAMSCFFTLCERQVHTIRKKFFEAVLNQDMAWFDKNEVGALTQKMSSGIEKIKEGASDKVAIIIQAVATMVAGTIVSFSMSWRMTLVMLIVVPFVVLTLYGSARAISSSMRNQMTAYSSAGGVAEEVISGIRTVASFNAQFFETQRYEKLLKVGRVIGIRKAIVIAFFQGLYLFILFASMGIAFWYGTTLVLDGSISPGTVFGVFWAVLIGAMRLGQAVPQINVIVGAKMAAGEIFSIIDRKPELDASSPAGVKLEKVKGRLEFCNIHFSYPSRPNVKILNGVSFTVEPGQTVALVGHSGCGKSTIISLLMRYYNFRHGSLTIDGVPITDLNTEWLRNTIGIVSQEPILFATTVERNLKMGKVDVTMEEMIHACKMANAHEFILKLPDGYHTIIGEGGVKLSGGQKQRLAIARALVRKPKILLLDEATSALDTESESIVQQAIDLASSGRTTVTIAHRLSTVRNANKIFVFDKGEIVECGTHDELIRLDGTYRQLILAQEIQRGPEVKDVEFSDDEFEQVDSHVRPTLSRGSSRDSTRDSARLARASDRIRRSMTSVKSAFEFDETMDELEEEGAKPATTMDILRFSRPEMKFIISGFILSVIRGAAWPAFSIIYGRTFLALSNAIKEQKDLAAEQTIMNSIAFATLGLAGGLTTFGSGSLLGSVGETMTMRLRLAVYRNILRQDGSYFDDPLHSTGRLTARLATDASNVQAAIDQRLADVLQGLTSLVVGVIVAFYFGWNVAPIGLATAALLVILQTSVSNYLKSRGMRDMVLAEEASRIATESIEYVRTVQALTRQKSLYNDFCDASHVPHRLAIVRGIWQSLAYALSTSFVMFNFGIAYTFGLFMIEGGYTTPYTVFQVIEALNMASFMIMMASAYFPEYLRAKISAGLMFSMISKQPKIDSMSDAGVVTPITGNIDASNIHFAYPNGRQQLILNGFSMSSPFGKTVALVGPSGCGKSTIIQLIERFYDVLGGNLSVDGVDIRKYNIRHLRNAMALVGQEPTLFNLSIRENIAYGIADKYETSVGARGTQLSGGQKQRIAIARAIIRDPKILLLDEATSALDTESEKVVQEALDRARAGRTCLVIAHRLSTIQHADLIAVVRDGRVIELGTHQQLLLRKGLYYRLVEKQSK